jgi:FMN-dependent NADH-azoreductase
VILEHQRNKELKMQKVFVINSSASGEQSVSRTLVGYAVQRLVAAYPGLEVRYRDLDADPVPHLVSSTVEGVRGIPVSDRELDAQALSDRIIGEVQAADLLVIGAPMYNFSIPTTLRAYFDHLVRPRVTFSYAEAGPQGLLTGKSAIVVESRGGFYSEGPAKAIDFQEPYLRQLLSFIGISEVTFIRAEKIGFGPEARELALTAARERIAEAVILLAPVPAAGTLVSSGAAPIAETVN